MLFEAPALGARELEVLAEIDDLRKALRHQLVEPRRWTGPLRRMTLARNIRASNSIEGYIATLDDVAAITDHDEPLDANTETRRALEGYRNAMTYVLQLAEEPPIHVSVDLIKSLHFMLSAHDLDSRPGRWRVRPVFVRNESSGDVLYEGADAHAVSDLMDELATSLADNRDHVIVRAAMAHLNLVMIHPFRDGNGRMARVLQSLVLASDGILSPEFVNVEEYLGDQTQMYYDVLAQVGGGSWQPERDAMPWIRFMLTAHLHQAQRVTDRINSSAELWLELELLAKQLGLPERVVAAMYDVANGYRLRRSTYMAALDANGDAVSDQTATRDLSLLTKSGVLVAHGDKRGRVYAPAGELLRITDDMSRAKLKRTRDPFA